MFFVSLACNQYTTGIPNFSFLWMLVVTPSYMRDFVLSCTLLWPVHH